MILAQGLITSCGSEPTTQQHLNQHQPQFQESINDVGKDSEALRSRDSDDFGVNKLYADGGESRIFNKVKESGKQGDEDGIRYNVHLPKDLVNYEATWYFTISDIDTSGGKDNGAVKIGSHGDESDPTALYDGRFRYDGRDGDWRVEAPHMTYKKCKGFKIHHKMPAIKLNKKYGVKGIMWSDKREQAVHVEVWMDLENNNKWTKISSLKDTGNCGIAPIGLDGEIPGPAKKVVATLRLNGAVARAERVSVREIAPGKLIYKN
jgi:hypothetical protein